MAADPAVLKDSTVRGRRHDVVDGPEEQGQAATSFATSAGAARSRSRRGRSTSTTARRCITSCCRSRAATSRWRPPSAARRRSRPRTHARPRRRAGPRKRAGPQRKPPARPRKRRKAEDARLRRPRRRAASTASAVKAKGGWSVSIDGAQSQQGGSPAASLVVQIVGPAGTPVSVDYNGKPVTEITLSVAVPGHACSSRRPAPGTYTVKAASTAANPKAPKSTCESTFTIVADDKIDFFIEGDFGKERRVREPDPAVERDRPSTATARRWSASSSAPTSS